MLIRGRIDGLLITAEQVLLEEIKTVQGTWDHEPNPLHWAQAKFYAWMHAREAGLKELVIQLVYLELPAGKVTEFRETVSFAELAEFCTAVTAVYIEWLRERHYWCLARNAAITALAFPFPNYRPGQRELAVAAYRTLANGGRLFLRHPPELAKPFRCCSRRSRRWARENWNASFIYRRARWDTVWLRRP